MSVIVSIEEVGPCRRQLRVEVPPPAVEAETQRVLQEYRRRAKLPGFRRGKVPPDVVLNRYRKEIDQEVVDRLLPRYWRQAQAESNLVPLLPPRVEGVDLEPGASLSFVATVEVRPEIELRNIRDFRLPEPGSEPSGEEVDKALEELRRAVADWVPVERPAGQGDLVTAQLVELDPAGEPRGEQTATVEVGDPRVWEELSLVLTGSSAGQQGEFTRRGTEGSKAPERRFRFTVTAVKERELPPLDDSLASKAGDFESLEELRATVRQRLLREKQLDGRRAQERAVLDQLRERHPLTLPEGVVEHEVEHLLQDYATSLARQGVDLDRSGIDWAAVAQEARPQAERRVHARLLLDAIADQAEVVVGEPELERAIAALARAQGRTSPAVRLGLEEAGRLEELRAQLRREKTLSQLLGDAPEATQGAGAEQESPAPAGSS